MRERCALVAHAAALWRQADKSASGKKSAKVMSSMTVAAAAA
jgi:hypothetical protein